MPSSSRALEGLRIIVAGDDAEAREALASLLEMNGAQVRRCRNGTEARQQMDEFRPDLLISDLVMPGEDGFELIARLRAQPAERGGQTPALAFSSVVDPVVQSLALSCGYQAFMGKPLEDLPALLGIVVALAGREPT